MYTILHIEKSDFFCKIVKSQLTKNGYSYISTDSFNEAYNIVRNHDINAIITSLYANGSTIENFIKDINDSTKKGIPIFVVTSSNIDEAKKKLLNLGVTDYILKQDLEKDMVNRINAVFKIDQYISNLQEAKIAIVDDSNVDTLIQKDLLQKYGICNIDCYNSGNELLKSNLKYDIYLVDIVLKNEFGEDLIRQIRKSNLKSSIIAVTGIDNPKTLAGILNCGADDFINKPINEELFISKLKSNIKTYILNKEINSLIKDIKK